jgi:tetratricopeptide (TPR) repeat protein
MPEEKRSMTEPAPTVAEATTPTSDRRSVGPVAPPAAVERYQILSEIGRGGMGVVYRATDTVLGREVAVKVLQEQIGPGSLTARRFLGEARIASQLQHPGIPAVHDLCTLPDGRPLLAMRLIKGRTLEELLKNRESSSPNLIAVFEQVCQAVGYAHAHKVVHRDLKPSNVMVGAFGEVQVMDWGLAKVLEEANEPEESTAAERPTNAVTAIDSDREVYDATRAGSVLGTPAFMPPEQAIGAINKIDARSDVFGLGAILCVTLTGSPPYVATDPEAARQLAAMAKLEEAFGRLDACGGEPELVALCKRCLSVERADRPQNAGEVAAAVAGLRAAAEERARHAELDRMRAEMQAAEQRRRRRVLALAAGAVIVALAAAAGVSIWQAQVARAEAANARNAEADATAARNAEEQARQDDREALEFMKTVLAYATSAGQGGKPKKEPTVSEALAAGIQSIEKRAQDKPLRPLVEARFRRTVGETHYRHHAYEEAAVQYRRVLEIHQTILGPDDELTWQAMNDLGEVYKQLKRFDEAEDLLKSALASKRAKLGNDHRSTMKTVNNLAGLYRELKRYDDAEPLAREAYQTRRRVFGPEDLDSIISTNNLGVLYMRRGMPADAEPYFREAAETCERAQGIRYETAQYWTNLGHSILAQKRYADAVPVFEKALALVDRITPGEGKKLRDEINGQMVKLYTEWGKPEEAAKWKP